MENVFETWKDIIGYESFYMVSNLGRIKTMPRVVRSAVGRDGHRVIKEKIHKPCDNGNGYKYVTISLFSRRKHLYIHKAVAMSFLGIKGIEYEVNHKNGDKADNSLVNLEWVTKKENMQHARRTGLLISLRGENAPCAKHTNEDVIEMRNLYKKGVKPIDIAKKFNVNPKSISNILKGVKYKYLPL